jgi:hypothetical protein
MTVLLDKQPSSYLSRLNEPDYSRILDALGDLADDPPRQEIHAYVGLNDTGEEI